MAGKKKDMRAFRNKFGAENQIKAERLELLEGI